MKTEEMICELRRLEEAHKDDFVGTCETNWSLMCRDVANRLEELLAAQEPRVMTLEKWREWKRKPLSQRDPVYYVDNKGFGSWIAPNDQLFIYATPELGYGTLFVCWTSRPDEKRRAETPWDC